MNKLSITALLLSGALAAQSAEAIRVEANQSTDNPAGSWYIVRSAATHPTTGHNFNWPDANDRRYSADSTGATGVPNDTVLIRWYPNMFMNCREPQFLTGWDIGEYCSAATSSFPLTGFIAESSIYPAKAETGSTGTNWATGNQYTADLAASPIATFARTSATWTAQTPQNLVRLWRTTLTTPVALGTLPELVMVSKYYNNGQSTAISDYNANHVSFCNTSFDVSEPGAPVKATFGFKDPAATSVTYPPPANATTGMYGFPWNSILRTQPFLRQEGDYAIRRTTAATATGSGVAACVSDAATTAGTLRWRVMGGASRSGHLAFLLSSFAAPVPLGIQIGPWMLEVNPSDPNLFWLGSVVGGLSPLDAAGISVTPLINVPVLGPAASGLYLTTESLLVNPTFTEFSSTPATTLRFK